MPYKAMTLNELIKALESIDPKAIVYGLEPYGDSYRNYYDRFAIAPSKRGARGDTAGLLSHCYKDLIGTTMHGYKGGDYVIDGNKLVYVANYGETGNLIIDLVYDEDLNGYVAMLLDTPPGG